MKITYESLFGVYQTTPGISALRDIQFNKQDSPIFLLINQNQIDSNDVFMEISEFFVTTTKLLCDKITQLDWKFVIEHHSEFPEVISAIIPVMNEILRTDTFRISTLSISASYHFSAIMDYLSVFNEFQTPMFIRVMKEYSNFFTWISESKPEEWLFGCHFVIKQMLLLCNVLQQKFLECFLNLGDQPLMIWEALNNSNQHLEELDQSVSQCTFEWGEMHNILRSGKKTHYDVFVHQMAFSFYNNIETLLQKTGNQITNEMLKNDTIYDENRNVFVPDILWLKSNFSKFRQIAGSKCCFNDIWVDRFYPKQILFFMKMYQNVFAKIEDEFTMFENTNNDYDTIRDLLSDLKQKDEDLLFQNVIDSTEDIFKKLKNVKEKKYVDSKENILNSFKTCQQAAGFFSQAYNDKAVEQIEFNKFLTEHVLGISPEVMKVVPIILKMSLQESLSELKVEQDKKRFEILEKMLNPQLISGLEDDNETNEEKHKKIQKQLDDDTEYEKSENAIDGEQLQEDEDQRILNTGNRKEIANRLAVINKQFTDQLQRYSNFDGMFLKNKDEIALQIASFVTRNSDNDQLKEFTLTFVNNTTWTTFISKRKIIDLRILWFRKRILRMSTVLKRRVLLLRAKNWAIIFGVMLMIVVIYYGILNNVLVRKVTNQMVETVSVKMYDGINKMKNLVSSVVDPVINKITETGADVIEKLTQTKFVECYGDALKATRNIPLTEMFPIGTNISTGSSGLLQNNMIETVQSCYMTTEYNIAYRLVKDYLMYIPKQIALTSGDVLSTVTNTILDIQNYGQNPINVFFGMKDFAVFSNTTGEEVFKELIANSQNNTWYDLVYNFGSGAASYITNVTPEMCINNPPVFNPLNQNYWICMNYWLNDVSLYNLLPIYFSYLGGNIIGPRVARKYLNDGDMLVIPGPLETLGVFAQKSWLPVSTQLAVCGLVQPVNTGIDLAFKSTEFLSAMTAVTGAMGYFFSGAQTTSNQLFYLTLFGISVSLWLGKSLAKTVYKGIKTSNNFVAGIDFTGVDENTAAKFKEMFEETWKNLKASGPSRIFQIQKVLPAMIQNYSYQEKAQDQSYIAFKMLQPAMTSNVLPKQLEDSFLGSVGLTRDAFKTLEYKPIIQQITQGKETKLDDELQALFDGEEESQKRQKERIMLRRLNKKF